MSNQSTTVSSLDDYVVVLPNTSSRAAIVQGGVERLTVTGDASVLLTGPVSDAAGAALLTSGVTSGESHRFATNAGAVTAEAQGPVTVNGLVLPIRTTAPTTGVEGEIAIYFDGTDYYFCVCTASGWYRSGAAD